MLIDESDEELLDRIEGIVYVIAERHPHDLRKLEAVVQRVVEAAFEETEQENSA